MPRLTTPANTFARAAIMRAAWIKARYAVSLSGKRCRFFTYPVITLREALAIALREVWAAARSERDYAVWAADQQAGAAAEAARLAALPDHARAVENASYALAMAEQADAFTVANNVTISAARARLASLTHASH